MTGDVVKSAMTGERGYFPTELFRRWGVWVVLAGLLLLLPLVFTSGTALTMMSLMGIAIVFALSYNILLGQTGMLSFGHAVYYGLGAYLVVHAINIVTAQRLPIPLPVLPLIGGLSGLFFGLLFGWVSTKRSGTAFAMISLGLAELVGSSSLILRGFFGGEEGVTTNRAKLLRVFDWNFGPQIQVYYLIAFWCLLCMFLMYKVTRTPLGRMCNAVRDNAERAQFVGYNPQVVRFLAFCLSGFFAGIAGGLAAINFEIANSALFSAVQSGNVLLATFIGGAGFFFGPVIGAVLVSYLQVMLSDITEVWQLYFGLMFIIVVMFAPQGIAGLVMMHVPIAKRGGLGTLLPAYVFSFASALVMATGLVLIIEMLFRISVKDGEALVIHPVGAHVPPTSPVLWGVALVLLAGGFLLFRRTWPVVANAWSKAARDGGVA
ncbi:MAG: branched-chain amino acid ABC transporter permease [Hyphomicrobiaceae bacterium]|nr:branched-chain amino acid ABC transporter permease [Hyphomicrobiaceae bacterium]